MTRTPRATWGNDVPLPPSRGNGVPPVPPSWGNGVPPVPPSWGNGVPPVPPSSRAGRPASIATYDASTAPASPAVTTLASTSGTLATLLIAAGLDSMLLTTAEIATDGAEVGAR